MADSERRAASESVAAIRHVAKRILLISWKNPTAADRNLGMDDYLRKGVYAALDAVAAVVPDRDIHAVGYCIGGTLLTIAAAALSEWGDTRIKDVTLLAAQTDFSEPGELSLYISPAQIEMLEALMYKEGVLDSKQMGGAFAMLRAHDLLWQPAVKSYLKGERDDMIVATRLSNRLSDARHVRCLLRRLGLALELLRRRAR